MEYNSPYPPPPPFLHTDHTNSFPCEVLFCIVAHNKRLASIQAIITVLYIMVSEKCLYSISSISSITHSILCFVLYSMVSEKCLYSISSISSITHSILWFVLYSMVSEKCLYSISSISSITHSILCFVEWLINIKFHNRFASLTI